jgi:hypothetical protein
MQKGFRNIDASTQLSMSQTSYKAPWWKTAIASVGILSSTIAVAPMDSFAADTVKVNNGRHHIIYD